MSSGLLVHLMLPFRWAESCLYVAFATIFKDSALWGGILIVIDVFFFCFFFFFIISQILWASFSQNGWADYREILQNGASYSGKATISFWARKSQRLRGDNTSKCFSKNRKSSLSQKLLQIKLIYNFFLKALTSLYKLFLLTNDGWWVVFPLKNTEKTGQNWPLSPLKFFFPRTAISPILFYTL